MQTKIASLTTFNTRTHTHTHLQTQQQGNWILSNTEWRESCETDAQCSRIVSLCLKWIIFGWKGLVCCCVRVCVCVQLKCVGVNECAPESVWQCIFSGKCVRVCVFICVIGLDVGKLEKLWYQTEREQMWGAETNPHPVHRRLVCGSLCEYSC